MGCQLIAVCYVQLLYDFLASRDIDAEKLLGPLETGCELMPMTQWQALLQRADAQLREPGLGLRIAERINPRHFSVAGYAALSCATLGDALLRLERYHRLVYDVNPARLYQHGDYLLLEWGTERGRPGQLVDETGVAALVQLARELVGDRLAPVDVHFVNPQPEVLDVYTDFFGCAVHFARPSTRLTLPLAYLQRPLRRADAALLKLLDEQAEGFLRQQSNGNLVRSCQQTLIPLLREGRGRIDEVARRLNRSPRTLQRHLGIEGTRFQKVLDDTRRQLAEGYLCDPSMSMSEIATVLGFSEQSAFSRAFRHWYGITPQSWRKNQRQLP